MKWLYDNYSLLIVIAIIVLYFVLSGKKSVKKWLLITVSLIEKEMGSGTGKLKLAQAYSDFVATYPIFSKVIPFAVFSLWVDSALEEMRHLLETNDFVRDFIEG